MLVVLQKNNFLGFEERFVLYEGCRSLNQINQSGIEIIIQTMPPFPWHFGGVKRYRNLFVDADEIRDFLPKYKYRICFDISHSMMALQLLRLEPKRFKKNCYL